MPIYQAKRTHPQRQLTEWNHDPNEVHEKVIDPEIEGFRTTIGNPMHVMIEEARGIVETVAIEVAHADNDLKGMAQRVLSRGQICDYKAQRAPDHLLSRSMNTHPATIRRRSRLS